MSLDPTGLTIKTLPEIKTELEVDERAVFGDQLQVGPSSGNGVLNGVMSEAFALVWEALQEVYSSFDVSEAEGVALDNLVSITGITRRAASSSTGTLKITGTPTTVVPIGSLYRVPLGATFETLAQAIIGGLGTISVAIASVDTGPIQALASTITEIVTAVIGVTSVSNLADVVQGEDEETDEELRARREASLQIIGTAVDGAIRAQVSALATVQDARVISNRTLVADAFGTPGKAFLTVVWPTQASDTPVWTAIFDTMPAGILSFGAIAGTGTDTFGNAQPVAYSVATAVEIHVLVVKVEGSAYPVGGDADIVTIVSGLSADFTVGQSVSPATITCAILTGMPTGSFDNVTVYIREGATPTQSTTYLAEITVDGDEIPQIQSGNVTVTA